MDALRLVPPNISVVLNWQGLTRFRPGGTNGLCCRMNELKNLVWNVGQGIQLIWQFFGYAITFFLALLQPRAVLAARLLAAESQLTVCTHRIQAKKDPRPRFTAAFRLLWIILSKSVNVWQAWVHAMQPATVTRWHRTAFRLFWRWKSRRKRGRPSIRQEMQALIRKLSQENPLGALWGHGHYGVRS